jgi:hypothetical protein
MRAAGVVIGHCGQIAVPFAVGDLVDPDPGHPVQQVGAAGGVSDDAFHDPGHRPPRDPQQFRHRRAGRARRQPRTGVLESVREPGARTSPRHLGHHHAVRIAAHPGSVSLQLDDHRTQVDRPPPALSATTVIAPAPPGASRASTLPGPGRTHPDHHPLIQPITLNVSPLGERYKLWEAGWGVWWPLRRRVRPPEVDVRLDFFVGQSAGGVVESDEEDPGGLAGLGPHWLGTCGDVYPAYLTVFVGRDAGPGKSYGRSHLNCPGRERRRDLPRTRRGSEKLRQVAGE